MECSSYDPNLAKFPPQTNPMTLTLMHERASAAPRVQSSAPMLSPLFRLPPVRVLYLSAASITSSLVASLSSFPLGGMQSPSADAVERVRAAVRGRLHGIDASHDLAHVERVERVGLRLATLEGADALLVQLACLLHDVDDWKYSGSDEAAAPAIRAILADAGFSQEAAARVVAVVQSVSFHAELGGAAAEDVESACVQDAGELRCA